MIQGFCLCLFFSLWNFLRFLEENEKMRCKHEGDRETGSSSHTPRLLQGTQGTHTLPIAHG